MRCLGEIVPRVLKRMQTCVNTQYQPHLRGDYSIVNPYISHCKKSAPLTWGLLLVCSPTPISMTISPTCVGITLLLAVNSVWMTNQPHVSGDYSSDRTQSGWTLDQPRVSGDFSIGRKQFLTANESAPQTWGLLSFMNIYILNVEISPTYVGITPTLPELIICTTHQPH